MKPVLKVPGPKRLKPKYDELLLNSGLKSNLRHYSMARRLTTIRSAAKQEQAPAPSRWGGAG
jgi:hypothetical protein